MSEFIDAEERLLAEIRKALQVLDPDTLADLQTQAIRRGRTLEEQVIYELAAHRGMVPIDPGDEVTAEFARLYRRMTQKKLLSDG
jgi:hypothetical protein